MDVLVVDLLNHKALNNGDTQYCVSHVEDRIEHLLKLNEKGFSP